MNRLKLASLSLEGLSVGDALGEMYTHRPLELRSHHQHNQLPKSPWKFTDDTEMALGLFEHLAHFKEVDQEWLAKSFAQRFMQKPERGYGQMARQLLREIAMGHEWEPLSKSAFGNGSKGNGSAMRAPIIGVWFHDNLQLCIEQAKLSSEVTHYHIDAVSGCIAVAITTAILYTKGSSPISELHTEIFRALEKHLPDSTLKQRITQLHSEPLDKAPIRIAEGYGAGESILALDTVPFCIWNAIRCADDFEEAIISTIECGGDCDTTAAIVGGMLGARVSSNSIPQVWRQRREGIIYQLPPTPQRK